MMPDPNCPTCRGTGLVEKRHVDRMQIDSCPACVAPVPGSFYAVPVESGVYTFKTWELARSFANRRGIDLARIVYSRERA